MRSQRKEVYGMAQEAREEFTGLLAARGVSRRDFMKYCGSVAALLGMSEMYAPQIASAIELGATYSPALWMAHGLCTGCTESMAQIGKPDVPTIVLDLLSLNYWETVMAASGAEAEANVEKTLTEDKGKYILIIEGSVMEGFEGNAFRVAGKTGLEELDKMIPDAAAVIAVGSCAVDGGWVAGNPNPAGATGVSAYCAKKGYKTPVVNLPTCPVNPEWIVAVLVQVLLEGALATPESAAKFLGTLDTQGRPKMIYGSPIHDNCPRRGRFENGQFVKFGSPTQAADEAAGFCLYEMGCKGPQTYTNCPLVRWNRSISWCVEGGSPCIGCGTADALKGGSGNWVDASTPFLSRSNNVRLPGVGGVQPSTIGAVVGGVAAAGLVVHGIASAAKGRIKGVPTETEKRYDAKKKGGDK
jgi:hydrogenase small subunit